MERIRLIIAGISLSLLLLGAVVWADITIPDATGPNLVYQTSPNVNMNYDDNATGDKFYITSVNGKGVIEYGIVSNISGYYMDSVSTNSTARTATETLITSWTLVGQ